MPSEAGRAEEIYRVAARLLCLLAALVVLLWFLYEIVGVLLLFAFALVLAVVLNAPTTWLEARGVPRVAAALAVCAGVLGVAVLLGWLVVPRVAREAASLVQNLPEYSSRLADRISSALGDYPEVERRLRPDAESVARMIPSLPSLVGGIGRYSFSLFGLLVAGIVLVTSVVYALANPRPLLRLYLELLPRRLRDRGARAFARGSQTAVGWMWANVVVGGAEAVAVVVFLTLVGVPGALVWGAFALFAELIPKIGPYLMALPPVLVALSVDPLTALWVALFYLALNEFMGDVVMPRVRASTMNLHPVSTLFAMLAMGSAFGLPGALVATPLAGFVKAYYEEFYLARQHEDPHADARVEAMLRRDVDGVPDAPAQD